MATTGVGEQKVKTADDGSGNGSAVTQRSEIQYPFYSVMEGIRVGEAVRKAGGNSAAEKDVNAALGLTSMQSKGWTYRISSAREFGVIERTGRGDAARIQVTDLYMAYAKPGDNAEKRAALMQMLLKPLLYQQLLTRYRGAPKPDATGLTNIMIRDYGILETKAPDAAKAFLASIEFAGLVVGDLVTGIGAGSEPVVPVAATATGSAVAADSIAPMSAVPMMAPIGQDDWIRHVFPLRKGTIITLALPPTLTKKDVERLSRWMQTLPFESDDDAGQS